MKSFQCLIVLCGLPGTGKTKVAIKLAEKLVNFIIIDQNKIRRDYFGMKRMPKTQERVIREIDRRTARYLNADFGVIFNSVNRYMFRRQQMYGVASCCGAKVVVLEVVCPEKVSKKRMSERPKSDGLLSDPRDARVYDKLKSEWDDVMIDFKHPGSDHVSYLRYDSHANQMERVIERRGMRGFISTIESILTKN